MAIDKLIPRYLNTEDDARLVKNVEMTDALNVRISADTTGDGGVIKNAYGNTAVSFKTGNNWQGLPHALPAGTNKVIGSVSDAQTGEIIFFVWNDGNGHSIYRFSTAIDVCELVFRDIVLGFINTSYVQADLIKTLTGDTLLYFTDDVTPPKKINVSRMIIGGYPSSILSGSEFERLQSLTLAKMPPLDPPSFSFTTDTSYSSNNVLKRNFQFAYQYIYFDGEVSAISKYTELTTSREQFLYDIGDDNSDDTNNVIRIELVTSVSDVRYIRILGREGDSGNFFIIDEVTNPISTTSSTIYYNFKNDVLYNFLSSEETDKLFDNVPLTAQSLTISGSRLFLGNYSEGYDNVARLDSSLYANYNPEPRFINIPVSLVIDTSVTPNKFNNFVAISVGSALSTLNPSFPTTQDIYINLDFSINLGSYDENDSSKTGFFQLYMNNYFINWTELNDKNEAYLAGGLLNTTTTFGSPSITAAAWVRLSSSPLSFSEIIKIPIGSSSSDINALVNKAIERTYTISVETPNDDYGVLIDNLKFYKPVSSINILASNASRRGFFKGTVSLTLTSTGATYTYAVNVSKATLYLDKLFINSNNFIDYILGGNPAKSQISFDEASVLNYVDGSFTAYFDTAVSGEAVVGSNPYTNYFQFQMRNVAMINSASFLTTDLDGYKSFKSGSTHKFGVVFYDDRNRSSFVQEVGSVYVEYPEERTFPWDLSTNVQLYGRSQVFMRIRANGPSWATRWSPVYAKTGTSTEFLQYSTIAGYIATNPDADKAIANNSNLDLLYVSMRSLEGKEDSYKESKGAQIEYKYAPGDKLRVISYESSGFLAVVNGVTAVPSIGDKLFISSGLNFYIGTVVQSNIVNYTGFIFIEGPASGASLAGATVINITNPSSTPFSITSASYQTKRVYANAEFDVVGYEFFTDDETANPILQSSSESSLYNTTGWFLALRDTTASYFDKQSIVNNTDKWSSKCIVEIFREAKQSTQEVYYEIGKSYPVINGTLYGDTRSATTASLCYAITGQAVQFYTANFVAVGDILRSGVNSFVVTNVTASTAYSFIGLNYLVYGTVVSGTFTASATPTLTISNITDAVISMDEGDCYYRPRLLRYGKKAKTFGYFVNNIESDRVSDFFQSTYTSIGRPLVENVNAKTVYRTGSVTYSGPFVVDSYYLGLSSFNPSTANFYDLNYIHGSIRTLVNRDDSVVFLQDKKVGLFPVNRNLVEFSDGNSAITASKNVVGTPQYYSGEYGVNNNPESVSVQRGRIYFSDIRSGKVMRLSQDGLTPISEAKMDSFFKDNFRDIVQFASVKKVIGGFDDENGEYIVTSEGFNTSIVNVYNSLSALIATYNIQTDQNRTKVLCSFTYNDDLLFHFNTEERVFTQICDSFNVSINAIAFLDRMSDGFPVVLGEEFIGNSSNAVYGIATDTNYSFFVPIIINISDGSFTFPFILSCLEFTASIGTAAGTYGSFTVGFDGAESVWNSRYSFAPENITSIDDTLYTFKNGTMYKHHEGANRATYYGVNGGAIVEVISNFNPSMVKAYESLSIEGTDAWAAQITNTDQSTSISSTPVTIDSIYYPYGDYSLRERNFYAYIPRDSSANTGTSTITSLSGSSEVYTLGVVSSSTSSSITFGSAVGGIPFPIGSSLYRVSGTSLIGIGSPIITVTGITSSVRVSVSAPPAGISGGDIIVAIAPYSTLEGDQIRDYYMRTRLSNFSISEVELYAINAVYSKSNLHNELGQ